MNVPSAYALVTPRSASPVSGESLPIADLINELVFQNEVRLVRLVGQGTSTALSHLAAEFRDTAGVRFLDGERPTDLNEWLLTVVAYSGDIKADVEFRIARWSRDDVIEYLMAKDPSKCKSVMSRLLQSDDLWLGNGSPQVLSLVLDIMISSPDVLSVEDAVLHHFDSAELSDEQRAKIGYLTIQHLFDSEALSYRLAKMVPQVIGRSMTGFLCNQTVRYAIAKQAIVEALKKRKTPKAMRLSWPRPLIKLIADGLENDVAVHNFLNELANKPDSGDSANAVSLLVCNDSNWRPTRRTRLNYCHAHVSGANWKNIALEKSSLLSINLANANLQKASLSRSQITSADFSCANLAGAKMKRVQAWRVDLSDATMRAVSAQSAAFRNSNLENVIAEFSDFSNAIFKQANLRNANFSNSKFSFADFLEADLANVDFSNSYLNNATLDGLDLRSVGFYGANLTKAAMSKCDMEGMRLSNVVLNKAWLNDAILTGTTFRDVSLVGCRFHNSKLAEIDWEGCDLRNAHFVNSHFQMGSTRCGKVDSPYPSHGTRTGFYTDEYDEQYFKKPEEIRKANLCDCDLRGAKVTKSDFYLVDLRGAKYDEKQREHFLRCGAILQD